MRERIVHALDGWMTFHGEDIFGLISRIADQTLYALVDWAKKSTHFTNLEVCVGHSTTDVKQNFRFQ